MATEPQPVGYVGSSTLGFSGAAVGSTSLDTSVRGAWLSVSCFSGREASSSLLTDMVPVRTP